MSARDSDTSLRAQRVALSPSVATPERRLTPERVEARRIASDAFGQVLRDEDEKITHVARVLGVSRQLVQSWADGDEEKWNVGVGDVLALHLAGSSAIALAYLDEVRRFVRAAFARGRSPAEHVATMTVALGDAARAITSVDEPAETRVAALKRLARRVDEAIADEERRGR